LHTEAKRGVIGEFIASITLFFAVMHSEKAVGGRFSRFMSLLFRKTTCFLRKKWEESG
jgi:hypothetical protein